MDKFQQLAQQAIINNYDAAREQLSCKGLFGKELDRKARELSLRMAGIQLPDGATLAWATPDGWVTGGYRLSVTCAAWTQPSTTFSTSTTSTAVLE